MIRAPRAIIEEFGISDNWLDHIAELRAEVERLRAALQAITDLCGSDPVRTWLADDMDRIARHALEKKP